MLDGAFLLIASTTLYENVDTSKHVTGRFLMAKFSAKCPDCKGKFPWEPTKGYPKACPLCGFDTSIDEDATAIVLPAFLSAGSKANDKLYRDMEKGSEFRAQAAADMAGVPVSEMSSLKITALNDRR